MPDETWQTEHTDRLIARVQDGDQDALNELLRSVMKRLEHMARRMLRSFPDIRRWEETGDLLQVSLVRLMRALQAVRPASSRVFFNLAATQIRRELLDLARSYRGPFGLGTNWASAPAPTGTDTLPPPNEPAAPTDDPAEMDRWCMFHEAVERLPVEQREAFALLYYSGWTRIQIAELMQVNERTVRRWLDTAAATLSKELGGHLPGQELG